MNSARTNTLQHCCFPWTLPEPTCYNIAVFHFFFHHLLPTLHCIPISPTSFSFSATRVSIVTTFVLINLWSLGFSPPRQYQCFIHIKFIFFSFPLDTLSLHPHLLLHPPCSYELVIFGIFMSQISCVICSSCHLITASFVFLQGSWNNTNVIFSPIFIFSLLLSTPRVNLHLIFVNSPSFSGLAWGHAYPYFINTVLVFLFITAAAQILCYHILMILLVQRKMVHVSCSIM